MKLIRVLPVLVILGIIIYLSVTSMRESLAYYVTASEFSTKKSQYEGKTLKIAGFVLKGSISKDASDPLITRFIVREHEIHIPVVFKGFVPDTFRDDAEVVVTGKWTGTEFKSEEILAKCASKYKEKMAP